MDRHIIMAMLLWGAAVASTPTSGADADLAVIKEIRVPDKPSDYERFGADKIQSFFRNQKKLVAPVKEGAPPTWEGIVAVGREMAVASGLITEAELDALKPDGYVVRGKNNAIAIAGARPIGTCWGTYAFLERVGLKVLPGDRMGGLSFHVPIDSLPPFELIGLNPYFNWHWGNHLSGGLYQSTWITGSLNDSAAPALPAPDLFKDDPVYGDHTAAFLVPKKLFMKDHPEYYAMHDGKRIEENTPNIRLNLCQSNPEVQRISVERALDWMEKQNEKRCFMITDGDARQCQCANCLAPRLCSAIPFRP